MQRRLMGLDLLASLALVVGACATSTPAGAPPLASPSPAANPASAIASVPTVEPSVTASTAIEKLATDGRILFNRHDTTTDQSVAFTIDADGTHERRVGSGNVSCSGWSSTGTRIACVAWLENGARPATARADGSDYNVLDAHPDRKRSRVCETWFPDGTRFLCRTDPDGTAADDGLYIVRASDGADLARLTVAPAGCGDGDEVLSPDGTEVLFDRTCGSEGQRTLFRVGIDGSHLVQLSDSKLSLVDAWDRLPADWSPDRSVVVFSAQPAPNPSDEPYTLYVVKQDGSGLHQIVPSDVGAVSAQWSPDGQWIALTSKLLSQPQVWLVHPDGSGLVRLTDGVDGSTSLAPVWSPDGRKLLFTNAAEERVSLWTMDANGDERSHLTDIANVESIGYAWGTAATP